MGNVNVITPEGRRVAIPEETLPVALRSGYKLETPLGTAAADIGASQAAAADQGIGGQVAAGIVGGLRGATLGLIDIGGRPEAQELREQYPITSLAGAIVGGTLPAVLSGGAGSAGALARATPAGMVARLGTTIAQSGRGAGALLSTTAGVAGGATEGAIVGAGNYLSDVALRDDVDASAEGFIASLGPGALFGGAAGGALALGERALTRASRLFPRSEVTREAVTETELRAQTAVADAIDDGNQLERAAGERLRQYRLEAEADPQFLADLGALSLKAPQPTRAAFAAPADDLRPDLSGYEVPISEDFLPRAGQLEVGPTGSTRSGIGAPAPPEEPLQALRAQIAAGGETGAGGPAARRRAAPVAPAEGAIAKAGLNIHPVDSDDLVLFTVRDAAGKRVGSLDAHRLGEGRYEVQGIELGDAFQRKGIGSDLYGRANAWLEANKGSRLVSDLNRTDAAEAAWQSLERKGLAQRLPAEGEMRLPGRGLAEHQGSTPRGFRYEMLPSAPPPSVASRADELLAQHHPEAAEVLAVSKRFAAAKRELEEWLQPAVSGGGGAYASRGKQMVLHPATPARGLEDVLAASVERGPRQIREALDVPGFKLHLQGEALKEPGGDGLLIMVKRQLEDGEVVDAARAEFTRRANGELQPRSVTVEPLLRRKGLAMKMYALAERMTGGRIVPSATQTPEGRLLSEAFRARRPSAAGEVPDWMARAAAKQPAWMRRAAAAQAATRRPVEEVVEQSLRGGPITGDVSDDIQQAAKVVGNYEAAAADLANAIGPAAPPGAQRLSQGYRAAVAKQSDQMAGQAGQVAGDIAARSALPRAAAAVAMPGAGAAADAVAALEAMRTIGGYAAVAHIPVIGPLLAAVLKARAVSRIYRRFGGTVPRSLESTLAVKSAAVRNRLRVAVSKSLATGGTVAGAARAPATSTAAILGARLFAPSGAPRQGREGDDAAKLYQRRLDELIAAQDPDALRAAIRDRLPVGDPEMAAALEAVAQRKAAFLLAKAPRQPTLPDLAGGGRPWTPSRFDLATFARYVQAANDPVGVIEHLADYGDVTIEAAEAVKAVYPKLFAMAQQHLLEEAPMLQQQMSYQRRLRLSLLFDVPLDGSLTPAYIGAMQQGYADADERQAQQAASGGSPMLGEPRAGGATVTISTRYQTPLDRRGGQ